MMDYVKSSGCYQPLTPDHASISSLAEEVAFADITKVSHEDFAKQITLIELSFFKAIRREEFASLKWNGREKHLYAPNIVASTRWFNQINFWVQKEILKYSCVSKRTEMLSFFIKISKKLVEYNNLYSAMSIISALQVECIYRLRHTWSGLGNKDRTAYRRLEELFSQDDNCRRQREHMNSIDLPGIPYLGLYLSDLTYTNVAQPRINGKPTAIWYTKINAIIDTIAYFQQSEYSFPVDETLNAYLCAQRYIEELQKFLEEDNYKTSLLLEPPPTPPPAAPTTPSLAYLHQPYTSLSSSTITNNNNSELTDNRFPDDNAAVVKGTTFGGIGGGSSSISSGFGFRSPSSKLSNLCHTMKQQHSHHHHHHVHQHPGHSRTGSNVSCKGGGATVNSSFESDLLLMVLPPTPPSASSSFKHITESGNDNDTDGGKMMKKSVQAVNKSFECKNELKSMRKISWDENVECVSPTAGEICKPVTTSKDHPDNPNLLCNSDLQSTSKQPEFLLPASQSSKLPPLPPRPSVDCEVRASTLNNRIFDGNKCDQPLSSITPYPNTTTITTTPMTTSTTVHSDNEHDQSYTTTTNSNNNNQLMSQKAPPVNHTRPSISFSESSSKYHNNLEMELSLCSVNDVFDSSAVAVAACAAAALTADNSAAYPTSSLKTMGTPTTGGFDTTNLGDDDDDGKFDDAPVLATSTPPGSPKSKHNDSSVVNPYAAPTTIIDNNHHISFAAPTTFPNCFGVKVICQGVVQRRTVCRFPPVVFGRGDSNQSLNSTSCSTNTSLFTSPSPPVHASNSSLSTASNIAAGETTKSVYFDISSSTKYRQIGFSKWRRLWATLVLVGDGLTAYMIYFEPKVKNAIHRSQFQAHQCQIHCLFDPPKHRNFTSNGDCCDGPEFNQIKMDHESERHRNDHHDDNIIDGEDTAPEVDDDDVGEISGLLGTTTDLENKKLDVSSNSNNNNNNNHNTPSHSTTMVTRKRGGKKMLDHSNPLFMSSKVELGRHRNGTLDPNSFMLTDYILGKTYRFRPIVPNAAATSSGSIRSPITTTTTKSLSRLDPSRSSHTSSSSTGGGGTGAFNWFLRSPYQLSTRIPSESPGQSSSVSLSPEMNCVGRARGLSAPGLLFIHSHPGGGNTQTTTSSSSKRSTTSVTGNEYVHIWLKSIQSVIEQIYTAYLLRHHHQQQRGQEKR
ncbi:unnamed protein product [Trichobilharzia szidati]|nr:unnamed protein product [Trichobilharzia szidati]